MQKVYDDPIVHFTAIVEQLNEKSIKERSETIKFDLNEKIDIDNTNRKNFGYAVFSKIYYELEIDKLQIKLLHYY